MTTFQRAFTRTGVEEEEITPPCSKTRSFDSLAVAHILQAKLEVPSGGSPLRVAADASHAAADKPPRPLAGSPSIDDAAAVLSRVHSTTGVDNAADCLMSLAALSANQAPADAAARAWGGGPHTSRKRQTSPGAAAAMAQSTRRRLKMRGSATSPSNGASSSDAVSAAAMHQRGAAQQQQQQQQHNFFTVGGVAAPIQLQGGATLVQLKLVAAAFKLCPAPTEAQMHAVAQRVGLTPQRLEAWFQSRRVRLAPPARPLPPHPHGPFDPPFPRFGAVGSSTAHTHTHTHFQLALRVRRCCPHPLSRYYAVCVLAPLGRLLKDG